MNNYDKENISKIIGLQFSIMSPYEIEKSSVAEITNRDTYINNKPVLGGLFDPRMGVLEPGLICPTDGLDYIQSPGYFGHIKLARPVFYIHYLSSVIKILRCVCLKCSKLLISKDKNRDLLKLSNEERWQRVFTLASKQKRCGEDSHDGCGCLQPKFKKEGLATLLAEWNEKSSSESDSKLIMKLIPEVIEKIFKKISDEDVNFMGFNSNFSRPEWMICKVLAIPPPTVRPSVKHDSQQKSEDDLTHIIVNIVKANKTLQEKIEQNASPNVIDDWTTVLQYYIATMVDNKIPGVAAVAQRSGRPLKAIKDRLNGKGGRVRGNLMGKRVDFSARSVITPDPNLSIKELGIPLKIAKNLTKPITVTNKNKNYLMSLVLNGPDIYPGAKIYEKKNGDCISLRYVDKESIILEEGDIIHRHIIDGDNVLFNRQPTLHRMSMMSHVAKIMTKGDTFRLNVGVTKPYNADFDGDEMNLHMPQDEESEIELKLLACVKNQIISPANNKSIVGIFQDSLLSCYLFSRNNISFNNRTAMNLLMHLNKININKINFNNTTISNFDLLSQVLPNLSLKYKTKKFEDNEDFNTSNNVLEINNGTILRGHIDKSILGDSTRGLIQRIYNDFGKDTSSDFIDDLQNLLTEYMKIHGYSVGISDLIPDFDTSNKIKEVINAKKLEVKSVIDEIHLGIFNNKTGKSNVDEFETQINNILNKAASEAGKIGRKKLDSNNRFVIMVNAGSKGSDLNISQMVSCLGQQNVDGKRIPYGFDNRTLPHFCKYDDSPIARGFVESSFISGLKPHEMFFHAMGGRVGLIDTAVKTSQTGYIQRRIIKGLEDLYVAYDMTVRNNKNKIVQFCYGEDGFECERVETQSVPFINMSIEELYGHFQMPVDSTKDSIYSTLYTKSTYSKFKKQKTELNKKCKEYIDMFINFRELVVKHCMKNTYNTNINLPVSFINLINNVAGSQNENVIIDITPYDVFLMIENNYSKLEKLNYSKPNDLFKAVYYYYLSPKELLMHKKLTKKSIEILLININLAYKKAIISPGEMVGMIAAQSIGEPTTQLTLNTFHFAGVASKSNVTRGVPRIEEILSLSENPKNPSCTVYLKDEYKYDQNKVKEFINELEYTIIKDIVECCEIYFDPNDKSTSIEEDINLLEEYKVFEEFLKESDIEDCKEFSKWIVRISFNKMLMLEKNITMEDIHFAINNSYDNIKCMYSDYNSDKLIFRIRMIKNISNSKKKKQTQNYELDQTDEIFAIKNLQDELLNSIILRGIKDITKVTIRKFSDNFELIDSKYEKKDVWLLDTVGSNLLDILSLDFVDKTKTYTNNIIEIYNVLGIEAARQSIFDEFSEVIEFDSTYINYHHLTILADRMTYNKKLISIFRHGINNDNIGVIAKASFEETPEMFIRAAKHGDLDNMKGVSANIMCGQQGYYGTSAFDLILDIDNINKYNKNLSVEKDSKISFKDSLNDKEKMNDDINIEEELNMDDDNTECSINYLEIKTNNNFKKLDIGNSDGYNLDI